MRICQMVFIVNEYSLCSFGVVEFFIRSQFFISERYTAPNILYNFELISVFFASVRPSHVIKITSVSFCTLHLNSRLSIMNLNLYLLYFHSVSVVLFESMVISTGLRSE